MNLFQLGDFTLHSGAPSHFKIECDALTEADWQALAALVASHYTFHHVEGVPRGGIPFAEVLMPYCKPSGTHFLLVDDVYTTGASLREFYRMVHKRDTWFVPKDVLGVVVFARGEVEEWVRPIFHLRHALRGY